MIWVSTMRIKQWAPLRKLGHIVKIRSSAQCLWIVTVYGPNCTEPVEIAMIAIQLFPVSVVEMSCGAHSSLASVHNDQSPQQWRKFLVHWKSCWWTWCGSHLLCMAGMPGWTFLHPGGEPPPWGQESLPHSQHFRNVLGETILIFFQTSQPLLQFTLPVWILQLPSPALVLRVDSTAA